MSERGFDLKRDGTGILIFSVAAFFAVLICKAWSIEGSLASATGTAVLADVWVSSLGVLPSLLVTAGLAFVGARMFLRADNRGWLRSAGALALTAVALSILLGAFSPTAGGKLGDAIGGSISRFTHVTVGVLVGLAALAFVVRIAWLRPAERADVESPTLLSTKKALKRDVADGVTRDEALALLPEDLNQEAAPLRILEPLQSKAMPPSPYPVDVRLRGEIPAGAKPLQPKHVPAPPESAREAHSVYRWTAPVVEEPAHAPRADLARTAEPEPELDVEPELEPTTELQALSVTGEWRDEQDLTDEDRFPVENVVEEVTPLPVAPRASWEQPSLFEAEAEDEPVDAYGTPLTLVESLRVPAATTNEELAELAGEPHSKIADEPLGAVEEAELDDEHDAYEESDESDDDEEDDEEADDEDSEDEALYDDEEETEEEEEDDDELDEADDDETEEVAAQEIETEEIDTKQVDTKEELAAEVEAEPALAAELNPDVEIPSMVAARVRKDDAPTSRVFEAVPMRDVVLQPKVAPADKADRTKLVGGTRNELLVEAGCLFLDRGRVAVSMLQRQYSMDFDEACALLDELQQMGLIGPYLGGQRRDILMTREQWLERVGAEAGGQAPRLADV